MVRKDNEDGVRWTAARLIGGMSLWVAPRVRRELARWQAALRKCPDPELRRQGITSIRHKSFHAVGGSVFGLDPHPSGNLVSLIVAYQTISDYLDNLCDRAGVEDGAAFCGLHQAMLDAVTSPATPPGGACGQDYYALYPHKADGGYLRSLVHECRHRVARLPAYHAAIEGEVLRFAGLYRDLQAYKHVRGEERVPLLADWFAREGADWRADLAWWEFAAACGSTLGIFSLLNLAARGDRGPEAAGTTSRAYFPWVCGLHILMDYFIDQEEDAREGDLNFVSFYRDSRERRERLGYFLTRALESTSALPGRSFHQGLVKGIAALYLSDPKVQAAGLDDVAAFLLDRAGPDAISMWRACRLLRRMGIL